MALYKNALERTLRFEAGYSNHPKDPGGRTMYGIAEAYHPDMWIDGPPSYEDAIEFYKRKYWDVVKGDDIRAQAIANELFDSSVNMGTKTAAIFMQRAYNILTEDRRNLYGRLVEDGVVGPKTIQAINGYCVYSNDWLNALYNLMNVLQGEYYLQISCKPSFVRGWFAHRIQAI